MSDGRTRLYFPDDGLHTSGEVGDMYCLAQGRNGSTEIKALDISDLDVGWIRIQPITRKQGKLMNCWIEVPNDPETLRRLSAILSGIANRTEDRKVGDLRNWNGKLAKYSCGHEIENPPPEGGVCPPKCQLCKIDLERAKDKYRGKAFLQSFDGETAQYSCWHTTKKENRPEDNVPTEECPWCRKKGQPHGQVSQA